MNHEAVYIDRIVREVLRRMELAVPDDAARRATGHANVNTSGELKLDCRVISLAALEGRLAGVRRVIVAPGAVITPAVKDLLREQQIGLQVGACSANGRERDSGFAPLAVATPWPARACGPLLRGLASAGIELQTLKGSDLASACRQLASAVHRRRALGLILTRQVPLAGCLANRNPAIRAAGAASLDEMLAAREMLGCNVLVLNPHRVSLPEQERMVTAFCRGGIPECPAVLKTA